MGAVPFLLPNVPVHLSAAKPEVVVAPGDSVGAHVRRRRKALGLFQSQAAEVLGVCKASVWNWENEKGEPEDRLFPAIIQFLGYEPWSTPVTLPERLRAERRRRGISMEAAAELMGLAHSALANWESGAAHPNAHNRVRVRAFLTAPLPPFGSP